MESTSNDKILNSGFSIVTLKIIKMFFQLILTIYLARNLNPSAFGYFAIAITIHAFLDVLRDFGLKNSILQTVTLSEPMNNFLFWYQFLRGVIFTFVTFGIGAFFYLSGVEETVGKFLLILSPLSAILGLASQMSLSLQRKMQFRQLLILEILALLVSMLAVILVLSGKVGIYLLPLQIIIFNFTLLILVWINSKFRPKFTLNRKLSSNFLANRKPLGGSDLITFLSANADTFVIGVFFGPTSLGLYNRAFQLAVVPFQELLWPLTNLGLTVFRGTRLELESFKKKLAQTQTGIDLAFIPLLTFFIIFSMQILEVLFGEQWINSSKIFSILCFGVIFNVANFTTIIAFLSTENNREYFKFIVITRSTSIMLMLIGLNWGVNGVATGYTSGAMFSWILGIRWLKVKRFRSELRASNYTIRIILISLSINAAVGVFQERVNGNGFILFLFFLISLLIVAIALCLHSYLRNLCRQIINLIRNKDRKVFWTSF